MNSPFALDSGLVNHQVRLAARPKGLPQAGDWQFTQEALPEPGPAAC
jgi:hypothetical protein